MTSSPYFGVLEVLGPDADDHVALLGLQAGRDRGVAEGQADLALLQAPGDEVHRGRADEAGHEQVHRVFVEDLGRVDLLDDPGAHHRDAVTEGHGLGLVVGDVEHRRAELVLDPRDLRAHLHAQLGVEVGERLVHQEGLRVAHDRAPHRHALALAAGEVGRLALQVRAELEDLGRLVDLLLDLGLADLRQLEREAHVLAHGHVRVQRVVLEDHRDVAIARRELVDALAADDQLAVGDVLQAGDHPQRRRLPAAGRTDEDHELAIADFEVHVLDGLEPVRIALPHVLKPDLGHVVLFSRSRARLKADYPWLLRGTPATWT